MYRTFPKGEAPKTKPSLGQRLLSQPQTGRALVAVLASISLLNYVISYRTHIKPLRRELLAWINDVTGLALTGVEQCMWRMFMMCMFAELIDDVPIQKVRREKGVENYIENLKLVQQILLKHHWRYGPFDAPKLARCKMQDNLEFLQWLYKQTEEIDIVPLEPETQDGPRLNASGRPPNASRTPKLVIIEDYVVEAYNNLDEGETKAEEVLRQIKDLLET